MIPGALKDMLQSEKGLMALLILIAVSAFVYTGHATYEQWAEVVLPMYGIYAATKAATSVGVSMAQRGKTADSGSAPVVAVVTGAVGSSPAAPVAPPG